MIMNESGGGLRLCQLRKMFLLKRLKGKVGDNFQWWFYGSIHLEKRL
jgi:hypothetical protein